MNITYQFFKPTDMEASKSIVPASLNFKGGTIDGKDSTLIDGKLHGTTITSTDNTPIYISSMAHLTECVINCHDLMIEGHFTGTINAKGKVELAAGCVVVGILNKSDEVYMATLADVDDLQVRSIKTPKVTSLPIAAKESAFSSAFKQPMTASAGY